MDDYDFFSNAYLRLFSSDARSSVDDTIRAFALVLSADAAKQLELETVS